MVVVPRRITTVFLSISIKTVPVLIEKSCLT